MDFPIDDYYDIYRDVMIAQKDSTFLKISFIDFETFEKLYKEHDPFFDNFDYSIKRDFPSFDFSEYNSDKSR